MKNPQNRKGLAVIRPFGRVARTMCFLICLLIMLPINAEGQKSVYAYSYESGHIQRADNSLYNEQFELMGQVFVIDTSKIPPAVKAVTDLLKLNSFYLSPLSRGIMKYLHDSILPIGERLSAFFKTPSRYNGGASGV